MPGVKIMRRGTNAMANENRETQLHTIRDLMILAAQRGAWLTLGEIAEFTEIGEASISAQLRHLRKARHGRHRVEKRRRSAAQDGFAHADRVGKHRSGGGAIIWEYQVLPPRGSRALEATPTVVEPQVPAMLGERNAARENPAQDSESDGAGGGSGREEFEEACHAEARD
jgi:hypothetical protein